MEGGILLLLTLLSIISLSQILIFLYRNSNITPPLLRIDPKSFTDPALNPAFFQTPDPDLPKSTCAIHEPVFTKEELSKIFTKKSYTDCKTPTSDEISFENFFIHAKCQTGTPLYSVDPGYPQKFGGGVKDKVVWKETYKFTQKSEYFFVKCGEKSIYATVFNRFNSTISEKANKIRFSQSSNRKNFNVFLLVFDSLSRYTSYNFLPKFTQMMKSGQLGKIPDYSIYELTKMGLPDAYTLVNMVQILYGDTWDVIKRKIPTQNLPANATSEKHIKFQKEHSIWNYYSKQGFTTMHLFDTVWDFSSKFVGRDIDADIVFQNFWRSAWEVYGWHDFLTRQRCVGRQNSHNLSFTYAYEYLKNYKDNNKFAYVHLGAAHESSGNVVTVDKDLQSFVSSTLDLMRDRNEDIVFFIISDHGFKYQRLETDLRFHAESNSPMTYIIMNKEVEKKLSCKEALEYNSDQLVGRLDLNLALKYLSHYPSGLPESQEELKKGYAYKSLYNFFTDKVVHNRTCTDIGVPSHRCVCSWFVEFDTKKLEFQDLNEKFKELVQGYFNSKENCKGVESLEIVNGKKFVIQPQEKGSITHYEIEFLANKDKKVTAEFMFCFPGKMKTGIFFRDSVLYPKVEIVKQSQKGMIQLYNVTVGECNNSCLC